MGYPHESKYKREDNWGEYGNCFSDYHGWQGLQTTETLL